MPTEYEHPKFFTANIDHLSESENHGTDEIATYIEECLMNCGFAVLRNVLDEPTLKEMQPALYQAMEDRDERGGWRRGLVGRRKFAEQAPLSPSDSLVAPASKILRKYVAAPRDTDVLLRRDNRQARTGIVRPKNHETLTELSLEGRMVVEFMRDRQRRALTHVAAGDAFVVHGNALLSYRTWNTTRRVDSDERAQRIGLLFRSRNEGGSIAPLGWL